MHIVPLILTLFLLTACNNKDANEVTVYVSEDQVFSEPVLKAFEQKTGIHVNAIYDTEESKSTGVMNRLIAEKENPQADVYWANEPIRAEVLRQKGILSPYVSPQASDIPERFKQPEGYWTGFSARIRVIIAHNGLAEEPSSLKSYADPVFYRRGVISNPLFGTTTAHIAALFLYWGDEKTKSFLQALKANGTTIATSNGESADLVSDGEKAFALVDSDDAVSRIEEGHEVHIIYPDQKCDASGVFVVPNAVMMIMGAPHPKAAHTLIDYLLDKETEQKLASAACAQIPLHHNVPAPKALRPIETLKVMQTDYAKVAQKMIQIQPFLNQWLHSP